MNLPVPGLFNTPYDRELELLKYYKGFGGLYEPDLGDLRVPRFVKTAVMIKDYRPTKDIVDYGFEMLDTLKVYDVPEWSIVFDVRKRNVYFKTRINPCRWRKNECHRIWSRRKLWKLPSLEG